MNPTKRMNATRSGRIKYSEEKLGQGGFGSVYKGLFNDRSVAVKIISLSLVENVDNEVDLHRKLNHENVLKLLTVENEGNAASGAKYIVLELCAGTLEDFIRAKYRGPIPSDVEVMYQITCGLAYIHSKKLIHRDVKPENILISLTEPVVMKVSDFGLSKPTTSRGSCSVSGMRGTTCWMAPEILRLIDISTSDLAELRATVQSDIFSTGCVFFYFLTRGVHPFGQGVRIMANILLENPVNIKKLENQFIRVISEMIESNPSNRLPLEQVKIRLLPVTLGSFKEVNEHSIERMGLGHKVICASFHPVEPLLVCGLRDGRVVLFKGSGHSVSFINWKMNGEFRADGDEKLSLTWNMDGTQLTANCSNSMVVIWRYPSRELVSTLKHSFSKNALMALNPFNQDALAIYDSVRSKKTVLVFSKNNRQQIKTTSNVEDVEWIARDLMVYGCSDGSIIIHKIDEGSVKKFQHGKHPVVSIIWNEEFQTLASRSSDQRIKIWTKDKLLHELLLRSECESFSWYPNTKGSGSHQLLGVRKKPTGKSLIACGLNDGSIAIWDTTVTAQPQYLVKKHSSVVDRVLFSPDGRVLSSRSNDKIMIRFTETWECAYIFDGKFWMESWGIGYKLALYDDRSSSDDDEEKLRMIEYDASTN